MCGEEGHGASRGRAHEAQNNYSVGGGQISLIIEFNGPTYYKIQSIYVSTFKCVTLYAFVQFNYFKDGGALYLQINK